MLNLFFDFYAGKGTDGYKTNPHCYGTADYLFNCLCNNVGNHMIGVRYRGREMMNRDPLPVWDSTLMSPVHAVELYD